MIPIKLMNALPIIFLLLIAWSMYRAQRDRAFAQFNLFDLLMENGRLSRIAIVFFGAFAFHTWVLARLTLDGKITESYMTFYGLTWAAPIIAKMFSPPPPSITTTTTATTMTLVEQPKNNDSNK
ncbi:MAG: hypothetical protein ABIT70_05675 [Sulfuriferula sp.]